MSPRAHAWLVFTLGVLVLFVLGFVTLFFAGSAATGCDQSFGAGMPHPDFCASPFARRAVALLPVVALGVYIVGGAVGIILMRGARRSVLVPVSLGLLAIVALAVDLVIVNA